jgi:hypothetical protein
MARIRSRIYHNHFFLLVFIFLRCLTASAKFQECKVFKILLRQRDGGSDPREKSETSAWRKVLPVNPKREMREDCRVWRRASCYSGPLRVAGTPEGNQEAGPQKGVKMHSLGGSAVWCLIAIQAAGLVSAFAARSAEGTVTQTPIYCAFYACVVLVSAATFAALSLGQGFFVASGATLATMALAATWDVRGARRPESV